VGDSYHEIIDQSKKALHVSNVKNIIGRNNEFDCMKKSIRKVIKERSAASFYISGVPGTGKTMTIDKVLNYLKKEGYLKKIELIKVNCMGFQTPKLFYQRILELLQNTTTVERVSEKIEEAIQNELINSKYQIIMVLDEIDQLNKNVITNIYSWTNLKRSSLILIGIANDINLIQSLSLKSRTGIKPILVNFDAYNKQQIQDIIKDRLGDDYSEVFDPKAIEFVAGKCAMLGDIRKALQLCTRALDVKLSLDLTDTNHKVTMRDLSPIISETMAPKTISRITSLPFTQQVILCCIVKLSSSKEVSLQNVYDKYRQTTRRLDTGQLGYQEFIEVCDILSTTELITIERKSKAGKTTGGNQLLTDTKITTTVTESEILFSISNDDTLKNLLSTCLT